MATSTVERINITLPKKLAKRLRKKGNLSAYIARSVEARMEEEARARAAAALAAAYREASDEEDKDWDAVTGDGL